MKKRLLLIFGALLLVGFSWIGCKASRAGYEGPDYAVISKSGKVEIRRYEDMVGAVTPTAKDNQSGRNSGFARLFRYITGENEGKTKIAMTSPVFMASDDDANELSMMFVMPKETVKSGVPKPSSGAVSVTTTKGGDFAVLRFKGHRSQEAQKEALASLRESITKQGLKSVGDPIFAYYDPPWIPEFARRNEVLLRITGVKE
jgi:hypothetical protein